MVLAGCQQEPPQQPAPPKTNPTQSHPVAKEAKIVVPPEVRQRWKSVRIAVVDKSNVSQKSYVVPIGGRLAIPSSSLTIEVEAFLPSFIMEGSMMTSSSNEPRNPGAKVRITDNGSVIFNGWLFSLFPKTHAFMHPKYGFTLVEVLPVGKK